MNERMSGTRQKISTWIIRMGEVRGDRLTVGYEFSGDWAAEQYAEAGDSWFRRMKQGVGMDGLMHGRMDGWVDRWMDGWTDGWTDGRTEGRMDGWMDG